MRPKILKITGLNSFEKEQTIDFEKLTAKGVFGIFGSTGSGKSTIIDAITMSLYGEIPRFFGGKFKQCININCETMHLSFTFNINATTYVVERSYKKSGQSMLSTLARLYTFDEDKEKVLAEKTTEVNEKIVKILGLNYKDFSRSVVLPQGKFSDFLLLANSERKEMLERIFDLEKYGDILYKNIKFEIVKNKTELQIDSANYDLSEEISLETLEKEKQQFLEKTTKIENLKKEKASKMEILKELENSLENYKEYEKYKNISVNMEERKDSISDKKEKVQKAKKAAIIKPFIWSLNEKESKIQHIDLELIEKIEKNKEFSEKLEKIKIEFEKFTKEKEEKYPKLLQKENHLEQAIDLLDERDVLNPERQKLLDLYKKQKLVLDNLLEKEVVLLTIKATKTSYIEKFEKEKIDIAFSNEYRGQVSEAFNISSKLSEIKNNYNNLSGKIAFNEKSRKQELEIEKEYENKIKDISGKISVLEEKIKEMYENKIGEPKDLLLMQSRMIEGENVFNQKKIELENMKKIQLNLAQAKEAFNIKVDLDKTQKHKLFEFSENYGIIKKEIEELRMKDIAYHLALNIKENEPCIVCGSLEHPCVAKSTENSENIELIQRLENAKKRLDILTDENKILNVQIFSLNNEISNHELQLKGSMKNLDSFEIETEKEIITKQKEKFDIFERDIKNWEKEVKDFTDSFSIENEKLNIKNLKLTGLKERINNKNILIEDLEIEFKRVIQEIEIMEKSIENFQRILKTDDFQNLNKNIQSKDIRRNEIDQLEIGIREELRKISLEENNINEEKIEIEKKLENIKTNGDGNKLRIDKINVDIENLTKGKNPKDNLLEVKKEINDILKNHLDSQRKFEESEKVAHEAEKNINILESNKNILSSLAKEERKKLDLELSENNFENEKAVMDNYIESEKIKDMDLEIEKYQEELKHIYGNLNRLSEKLQAVDLENLDKNVKQKKEDIFQLDNSLEEEMKSWAIKRAELVKMENDLENCKKYLEKKKILLKRIGILEDLADLLEGKKFIEYVAKRHLKYIVVEASRKLKEMTSMRYALELDESDFIIRDDLNGGLRRSPRTLSGGETFMVSLCLALALSSKMQLKSNTPLEIFFLDEGFGTLDPLLIDVVIDCLMQLQNENFSIGIITHIEELKNRIPVKLLVSSARDVFNGSEVSINY